MEGQVTKLEGFRELSDALGELGKSTERSLLRRLAIKALEPMRDLARDLAPVDEGRLRDSIVIGATLSRRAKAADRREPRQGVRMFVGSASRNAVPREFGAPGRGTPPHPFMRPAFDAEARGVIETVQRELRGEIEKTAARAAKRRARK